MNDKAALDLPRLRDAIGQSCLMLTGQATLSKPALERHLRELLDCINMIDNAGR